MRVGARNNLLGDILRDGIILHRHHGDGFVGRKPIGLVITGGVVTHVIHVAEEEGHRAECGDARAGKTCTHIQKITVD